MKKFFNKFVLSAFIFIVFSFFGYFYAINPYYLSGEQNLASESQYDLLQKSIELVDLVQDHQKFTEENCMAILKDYNVTTTGLTPARFNREQIESQYLQIIENLFRLRYELHERAGDLPNCANEMRNSIRIARYIEEYLLEAYSGVPVFNEKTDPKVKTPLQGKAPWLLLSPKHPEMTIRSGDIIISRGNAFTSSAIARMGEIDAQFSHLALVYVHGDNGSGKTYTINEVIGNANVMMLEMHIEIGSTVRPMRTYLTDGNARNLVFRFRGDPKIAHRAAESMYKYITNHMKEARAKDWLLPGDKDDPNYNVPYDFKADLSSTKEMFCTEVGYAGYKNAGVKIPSYMSQVNVALDIPRRLGISSKEIFLPGDMEIEPQFEMIGEYRDLRKLHDIRMKDAVLASIYDWQTKYDYRFYPDLLKDSKAVIGSVLRIFDLGYRKELPKNMELEAISTVFILEEVGKKLQSYIENNEKVYLQNHPKEFRTFPQHLVELEKYRHADRNRYIETGKSAIHNEFHNPGD